jgi:hypothetical protein
MIRDLESAQAAMKNRPQRAPERHIAGLKKARALRREIRKRKRYDRERYRSLLAEHRTLKRDLRQAYKGMLRDFRDLCATMKEATAILRGALGDREKQSAAFIRGVAMGKELVIAQQRQAEIDQQAHKH